MRHPGGQTWRVKLFEGWDLLRRAVAESVPSARWWLWGCFVTSHSEPLFGDAETVSAVVLLLVSELPAESHRLAMLVDFLRSAQHQHRVDVGIVFEFDSTDPRFVETIDALEFKWRPRAVVGIADHETKELVPAGFVEVLP